MLTGLHCAGWEKIELSTKDELTPQTEEDVLSHNEYGVESKCWTAPDEKGKGKGKK